MSGSTQDLVYPNLTPAQAGFLQATVPINAAADGLVATISVTPQPDGKVTVGVHFDPAAVTASGPLPAPTEQDFVKLLRRLMDECRMSSRSLRAGTAAICFGETGFKPRTEESYRNTTVAHIRDVFGTRISALSDADIENLKQDDEAFFNFVYGGDFGRKQLGNTFANDGYTFIGRGPIQLTGRSNYTRYGDLIGIDLTKDPDLVNNEEIGCKIAVLYMLDRYHGGGFEGMKRAVGNVVATSEIIKDRTFAKFMASGQFGGTDA
jgi:predicted chitinase